MITTPRSFRRPMSFVLELVAVVSLFHVVPFFNPLGAEEPLSHHGDFAQRLREPHTGIADGLTLRIAIDSVADSQNQPKRHINTWLDRKVNPDALVSPGGLGPTRYASLSLIAKAAGCVCYPVDNCILIGRPAWVAELSREFFRRPGRSERPARRDPPGESRIDLVWPPLTTPTEALQIALGHSAENSSTVPPSQQLPHDLWPAVDLRDISPRLAQSLITGQFLSAAQPPGNEPPFGRSYRFPSSKNAFESIKRIDPSATFKTVGAAFRLSCSPAAHQLFCLQMLSVPIGPPAKAAVGPAAGDPLERLRSDKRKFSLTVQNEPAGKVIRALAGRVGLECQFAAAANPQLEQMVSFSAVDQTLWQLVRLITDKTSLKIEAANGKLAVSAK